MSKFEKCPCASKSLYHKCCKPYHDGTPPEDALHLMRSRYAAYALGLADYIIDTTHSAHPEFTNDRKSWKESIESFSNATKFDHLTINEFIDGEETATVTFTAHLRQAGEDVSFGEKSFFVKENGNWLYKAGETFSQ
ncbi:MAG: zinc chelation protein SecC [Cyanobacteria bacterium PR.3.49]|nr:zinc chelation protein SecC [Cyanobacteria bacterium PR.3.49]